MNMHAGKLDVNSMLASWAKTGTSSLHNRTGILIWLRAKVLSPCQVSDMGHLARYILAVFSNILDRGIKLTHYTTVEGRAGHTIQLPGKAYGIFRKM